MALRQGLPAIRAEWLRAWLERGTLEAYQLLGSKVLVVSRNARCQKTTYEDSSRRRNRYWLAKGIFLVPRWDPLEEHLTVADKVENLSREELARRGMFRLEDGTIIVLIYQHDEDLLALQRQQWHIRLETYSRELQGIEADLDKIESQLTFTSTKPPYLAVELRRRRRNIHSILTALAPRGMAAKLFLETLKNELQREMRSLEAALSSQPIKKSWSGDRAEGLRAFLVGSYKRLGELQIRPVVRPLGIAKNHLVVTLGSLDVGDTPNISRQIKLAMEWLVKALKLLEHPEGKMDAQQAQHERLRQKVA